MSDNKSEVYEIDKIRKYGEGFEGGIGVIKKVADYNKEFVEDAVARATDIAATKFKADSKLNAVTFSTPYGTSSRGSINVGVKRRVKYGIPGSDKEITKSAVTVSVKDPGSAMGKKSIRNLANKLTEQFVNK